MPRWCATARVWAQIPQLSYCGHSRQANFFPFIWTVWEINLVKEIATLRVLLLGKEPIPSNWMMLLAFAQLPLRNSGTWICEARDNVLHFRGFCFIFFFCFLLYFLLLFPLQWMFQAWQGEAPFLSWSFRTNWLQKQLDVNVMVKDRTDHFLELRAEYLSYFAPPRPRRQRLLQPMCTLGLVYTQFPPLLSFQNLAFIHNIAAFLSIVVKEFII